MTLNVTHGHRKMHTSIATCYFLLLVCSSPSVCHIGLYWWQEIQQYPNAVCKKKLRAMFYVAAHMCSHYNTNCYIQTLLCQYQSASRS